MTAEAQTKAVAMVDLKAPIKLNTSKAAIGKLKKKYAKVPDGETEKGYEFIVEAKRVLTPLRTGVEKEAKIQKKSAQDHINNINKEANSLTVAIAAIEKPLYAEKKRVDDLKAEEKRLADEKEDRRIAEIEAKVDEINELTDDLLGADLELIEERLAAAEKIVISDKEYMEFVEPAALALDSVKGQLVNAVTAAKALAEQQKEIDAQNEKIDDQKRIDDIKGSIQRIRMAPVDLIGRKAADIQSSLDKLNQIEVGEYYAEFADEATAAIEETKGKLEVMISQQKATEDQQAEIDQNNKEAEERAETERKETERKAEEKRKADLAKANAAALAARMPEDQKLREYAEALVSIEAPEVETDNGVAVLRSISVALSDLREYVFDSTQDPAE